MAESERSHLRMTFGEDAELYDRCRPGYPDSMFTDLSTLAGIDSGSRVLEIGCGTGQATVPLARFGCAITAVELSENLAAIAQRNLAEFENTHVAVAAFERWPLPDAPFDAVLSATAFHWIAPELRVAKAADALRIGGALAVVSTHHVAGGTHAFFEDAQRCYERFDPATEPGGVRLRAGVDVPYDATEFDASDRFGPVEFRRYEWEETYTSDAYLDLVCTYSGHRALPAASRARLLDCLADLIDRRYDGRITKRHLTQLTITRKAA